MNLALFDFDGTITSADTFTGFLRFALSPARRAVGGALVSPLVLAYRANAVSASRARTGVSRAAFAGARAAAVRERGRQYAAEVLPGVIRQRAMEQIAWHQRQGDAVVVVSASLDVYVGPWCQRAGVEWICTELEERGGRFTGRYRHGDCSGCAKARRIRERYDLRQFPIIYAYGDTAEDREMLELAHRMTYCWTPIATWEDARASGAAPHGR
jgi:phosphatidylglycerophosphatase C